ncbi:MAG: elongation factor Ts [Gammaproteobacteria bacterium]|nr:elongation factor Ts [Gammaproteobacteria bacterium]
MAITASLVKELRERTGSGMMECKKALVAADGDIEKAAEDMRKSGASKADKKAGRIAAEGAIKILLSDDAKSAVILEVNSETDFVAKDDNFIEFVNQVATVALAQKPADVAALNALTVESGDTVEEARKVLISKIGENIQVRRFNLMTSENGQLTAYLHGARIGVLVDTTATEEMAKDVAMHVAAVNPQCISEDQVPAADVEKEKGILVAQAEQSGKPAEIIEKMIVGRMKKYLAEITLMGQAFVKDPDQTVGKLLKSANADIADFTRYEVGDGIEKKQEDFAAEVAAQLKG